MAVQTLHDSGSSYSVTPQMDGGVYQVSSADCVVGSVGDEMAINYTSSSLNVSFNAGSECVIGGSFFKITSTEAVTLSPNATIYLCANIDLTKQVGTRGSFVQRTSSNMQSDNLNGSGSSRDLLLYIVTTSATGVTDVQDMRKIMQSGGVSYEFAVSNVAPTQANNDGFLKPVVLASEPTTKYNGYIYFIKG